MNHKTTVIGALVLAAGVGWVAVPASAVTADCNGDFGIPASEPDTPRTLAASGTEVGSIEVSSGTDPTIRVELETDDDMLEFGIFEVVSNNCVQSTNVNTVVCQSDVTLDTTPVLTLPPVAQECELDAPSSGTRTFYFVFENKQSSDSLGYSVWKK